MALTYLWFEFGLELHAGSTRLSDNLTITQQPMALTYLWFEFRLELCAGSTRLLEAGVELELGSNDLQCVLHQVVTVDGERARLVPDGQALLVPEVTLGRREEKAKRDWNNAL